MSPAYAPERACAHCGSPFRPVAANVRKGFGRFCTRLCGQQARTKSMDAVLADYTVSASGCFNYNKPQASTHDGYAMYRTSRNGRAVNIKLSRVVLSRTYGIDLNDRTIQALHTCDNRLCIRPDHIVPGSHKDNMADMVSKNRQAKGVRSGVAKLSDEMVVAIRQRYAAGEATQVALAKEYGVTHRTIGHVVNNDLWVHVPYDSAYTQCVLEGVLSE